MIHLTPQALERAKSYLEKEGGLGLRIGLTRTGCSGWAYTVELAEHIADDDQVFDSSGVSVVVAEEFLPMIDGTEVDFALHGLNKTFTFRNPNAKAECGCGESISFG